MTLIYIHGVMTDQNLGNIPDHCLVHQNGLTILAVEKRTFVDSSRTLPCYYNPNYSSMDMYVDKREIQKYTGELKNVHIDPELQERLNTTDTKYAHYLFPIIDGETPAVA